MSESDKIRERNPMHEAGAGEIASILHNESKGGNVLGLDRVANELSDEERSKSETGIITGKQNTYPETILNLFKNWIAAPVTTEIVPFYDYVVEVFVILFNKTGKIDGSGITHFRKEVFPIMKVVQVPLKDPISVIKPGMLLKGPNELNDFGINPEWYDWEEERNSNASTQTKTNKLEPPYYWGTINIWNQSYGCPENILHLGNVHNTRFLIPFSEIKAILNPESIISNFETMINELEKTQD